VAYDPIDVQVGSRIRLQRNCLGISQTALASTLGITFQQVQKYERGLNRVSASKLQVIAKTLGVPVSYFFEDGPNLHTPSVPSSVGIDPFQVDAEMVKLVRYFSKIANPKVRQAIIVMIESIAPE
jgi:transcriptional regulator with XRE-family HTH domain